MLTVGSSILAILSIWLLIFSSLTQASVLFSSAILHYVLRGTPNFLSSEYGGVSELVDNSLKTSGDIFALCFFKNTENMFSLGIGMGFIQHWVWEANRNHPVRLGATLTLGKDGNLVLADVDGRIAWQTNTTNKGVVGIKLLENGNLVLYDAKGNFIWQSFDYPTDTLLPGQSIRTELTDKLVSRASPGSSFDGPYSLMIRPGRVTMYYKSKNTPNLLPYYTIQSLVRGTKLKEVKFKILAMNIDFPALYLNFLFEDKQTEAIDEVTRSRYNNTLTFLRLDYDGNMRVYSYNANNTPRLGMDLFWAVDFILFNKNSTSLLHETACQLPERCGNFGVCNKDQCVACPSPKGLLDWNNKCEPPKLVGCSGGKNVKYFKIEGVNHFTTKYFRGRTMKQSECEIDCSKDCKCLGYFYRQDKSRCWIVYDLKTLTQSGNPQHLGYIKMSN